MDGSEDESLPQDQADDGSEDTFFVPPAAAGGEECKAGDILKFEVLGKDADGNYEVKPAGKDSGSSSDDFTKDLRSTFAKKPTAAQEGGY